ncbi:L,D-transpeptidase family protein [Patulibacter minatonensis]|uniref:L,D-transpeptidase family protein n=1 Tax=Patulibacter minatonensis TaxID=298163 RepID=UPI000684AE7B|nr:L,D-transpeptidase [Patulibacter minatonensis]
MPSYSLRVAPAARTVLLGALVASAVVPASASAAKAQATTAVPATTTTAPATPTTPADPARPVVAAGVKFGDVDLSGLTQTKAKARLRSTLEAKAPSNASVALTVAGRPHTLKMSTITYRFDLEAISQAAAKAAPNTSLPVVATWSKGKLARWYRSISSMQKSSRNATIKIGITKQRVTGSRNGWKLDRGKLESLVDGVLKDPTKPRALKLSVVRTTASVTVAGLKRQYATLITVDRPTFRLRVFKRLKLSKTYKIAVGSEGHTTPAGMYSITSKQVNPAWHVPNSAWAGSLAGQVIPGGAPNNPLKARWLGLRDGIGIHGTSEAWSIGTRASHGCLRMHPSDVIDLYGRIPMGTPVKIR